MASHVQSKISLDIHADPKNSGQLIVTCTVMESGQNRNRQSRSYSGTVSPESNETDVQWSEAPPQELLAEVSAMLGQRLIARREWLRRVESLVSTVEQSANELGWVTRRSQKKIEDWEIGNHLVPILIMQQDVVRLLLEPISRKTPGSEGLVDLYLMPGLDDIASILFYDSAWHIHYFWEGDPEAKHIFETTSRPLNQDSLRKVFEGMLKSHAS